MPKISSLCRVFEKEGNTYSLICRRVPSDTHFHGVSGDEAVSIGDCDDQRMKTDCSVAGCKSSVGYQVERMSGTVEEVLRMTRWVVRK